MADDSGKGYALGRLVLDYIKAFMWPAVALVVVLIYQDDVRQILSERQVDIFGLRIGERVEQIESQTMAEIEDIRLLLDAQRQAAGSAEGAAPTPELSADIDTKLSSLERNLSREIAQVQTAQQEPQTTLRDDPRAVRFGIAAGVAERAGFEALIARDVDAAIAAFDEARAIWPEYHNVAEIGRALRNRRDHLADPQSPAWTELYRDILTRYSWGLPADLRDAIRSKVAAAY